ncbi:MAG: hypothetical protein ABIH28_01930 [archaeon]
MKKPIKLEAKVYLEQLYEFRCSIGGCNGNWSIGDAKNTNNIYSCSKCGKQQIPHIKKTILYHMNCGAKCSDESWWTLRENSFPGEGVKVYCPHCGLEQKCGEIEDCLVK